VASAQTLLKECGYALPKWGIDGQYGDETEAAMKCFQAAFALKVDGILGPKT
jgi:peptidoglycan hydrolase-like protein with peptidoglycan-binding domain